uniref:Uncharacterized protein n=1 Tax=uncultured prokaryote TaxID=198431 RepID=A0A0H5Q6K8_9ZZZZ|nr:hypothetical protein [uncultured prokaryote]
MFSERVKNALTVADYIHVNLSMHVCGECEDQCWSVRAWIETDLIEFGGREYIVARDHTTRSGAARLAAGAMSELSRVARLAEQHAWLIEHQEELDLKLEAD